jgi:hypothetical protein
VFNSLIIAIWLFIKILISVSWPDDLNDDLGNNDAKSEEEFERFLAQLIEKMV